MNKIGIKIRKLRENRGISQSRMATDLDMSQSYYCKIEKDDSKLSVNQLFEICEILSINPISIFNQLNSNSKKTTVIIDWQTSSITKIE